MEGRRSRAGERKEESRVEEREGGMKVRLPDRPPLLRTKSLVLMEEAAGGKGEMFFKEKCSNKGELLKHLSKTGFLEPENPAFFHGRIYSRCPPAPVVAWHSSDNPRWKCLYCPILLNKIDNLGGTTKPQNGSLQQNTRTQNR